MKLELPYVGSFQDERRKVLCENPLTEVWHEVAHFGTAGYLDKLVPDKKDIDWEAYRQYAAVRVHQAIEFQEAARQSTLLTAPLPLYYAFLNLTKAFMAIGPEVMPRNGHGLRFKQSDRLLASSAQLCKGAFTDYLDGQGLSWKDGDEISLADALGFIVEHTGDYRQVVQKDSNVQKIVVRAIIRGDVRLIFHNYTADLKADWAKDFPGLAGLCEYEQGQTLRVIDQLTVDSEEKIAQFLREHFMPFLVLQGAPTWFAFKRNNHVLPLNRIAYYYVAVFILGSVVRYEPELLVEVNSSNSELGWFLQKFLRSAERFFPQLKLMELTRSELYFSGSSAG